MTTSSSPSFYRRLVYSFLHQLYFISSLSSCSPPLHLLHGHLHRYLHIYFYFCLFLKFVPSSSFCRRYHDSRLFVQLIVGRYIQSHPYSLQSWHHWCGGSDSFPCKIARYAPYHTVLYCTVLYCTVLYCTVLYCTPIQADISITPVKRPDLN